MCIKLGCEKESCFGGYCMDCWRIRPEVQAYDEFLAKERAGYPTPEAADGANRLQKLNENKINTDGTAKTESLKNKAFALDTAKAAVSGETWRELMGHSLKNKAFALDTAKAAVCGDRADKYGTPEDNFGRIAVLWNAWFEIRGSAFRIEPWEVAILMDVMKTARLARAPYHADSWVDKAGYAACGYDITRKKGSK